MMNRRMFNLFGLSMVSLSPSISISADKKKNKSVLWIWLGGGASHIETFNPIPTAPVENRSVRGHIMTDIGEIGADFTHLAKLTKDITILRTLTHRDNNHRSASHWVNTGEPNFRSQQQIWPAFGAVAAKKYGTNHDGTGIPLYIKTGNIDGAGDASFLGGKYKGYEADLQGINNLYLKDDITKERFYNRLKTIEAIEGKSPHSGMSKDYKDLRDQAVTVITGSAAQAFRLENEPNEVHSRFKTGSTFGRDALLSVRLIQNEAKFVTLVNNGWDMHNNIDSGFSTKGLELDYMLYTIIEELKRRDLFDSTLIVLATEFGRTSKVNGNAGRDHQSACNNVLFAGGGYNHGRIIGKTNSTASVVEADGFSPKDLTKTVLNHIDIHGPFDIIGNDGRPYALIEANAKNILE